MTRGRREEIEMKPVLVAYDGSESARRALDQASAIADGHPVTVVSVAELLPQVGRAGAMLLPEEVEERERELAEAVQILKDRGVSDVRAVERRGDAAEKIIDEAEREDAELIVLGTRGLSPVKGWMLGSVSTRVMHHAPCNVLVVR
jgi:nucleotide-binding universal stress UspA family protein